MDVQSGQMAPQTLRNGRGLRVKSWMGVDGGRVPPPTTVIQCQRAEGVKKKKRELGDGQSGCK